MPGSRTTSVMAFLVCVGALCATFSTYIHADLLGIRGTMPANMEAMESKVKELAEELRLKSSKTTDVILMATCYNGENMCYVYDIMAFDAALEFAKGYDAYLMGGCPCKKKAGVFLINREGQVRPRP